jgi:CBS domain-containing protein
MKTIQVGEVHQVHGKASISVPEDATLEYVVALLGHERHLQGVFIVDSSQRYVGMVSRFDLLRWTQLQLHGGKRKAALPIEGLMHLLRARKAKDLETRNSSKLSLSENDTLEAALDLMIEFGEDIVPVIDAEGRIIGDLSLSELLSKALEVGLD